MTTALAQPVAGPSEVSGSDYADCGKLAAEAILRALGVTASVPSPDEASADQIAAAINSLGQGLHADVTWGDGATTVANALAQGRYAILGVNCKSDATYVVNYNTGIRHWVAAYDTAGWEYNCWQSTFQQIDFSACHNGGMGTVEVWRDNVITDAQFMCLKGAFIRTMQHLGVDVGDWGTNFNTPIQNGDWNGTLAGVDSWKFPTAPAAFDPTELNNSVNTLSAGLVELTKQYQALSGLPQQIQALQTAVAALGTTQQQQTATEALQIPPAPDHEGGPK